MGNQVVGLGYYGEALEKPENGYLHNQSLTMYSTFLLICFIQSMA